MAMAVQKLFPNSKVTIGPWIENGFYYDFDMEPLTDKDLKKIKKEMVSIHCLHLITSGLDKVLWEGSFDMFTMVCW
jgi:threonyl-tRNA synthetase